ncbi:hypothetical protein, partial [Pseudoalteromonas sp. TB43-MNA-CIBAN-0091]|uniref:hypothetical protein n=1 Tax=Pseudoalteromonas sp. TB43-MNA-CIBAN-0091 TaxID=3140416 RepID=UPI0033069FD3
EAIKNTRPHPTPTHLRNMSFTPRITTLIMYDAIAVRFGKTRIVLLEPALELYAEQVFLSLSDEDRNCLCVGVECWLGEYVADGCGGGGVGWG